MLWQLLLICLLRPVGCSRVVDQDIVSKERHGRGEVAVTTRPHIYYCRSPNMEDFTCWWHPLDNLTDGEQVAYVLRYSKDKGPKHECPDYVTSGPNSCHFDRSHTSIWKIYCMNVVAVTARRNYTSQEHCLDVAEIVQTEAPVNLSYALMDAGGDEMGHDALLSWTYPVPSDLQYGWITLVYELQYRRVTEPDNWKVAIKASSSEAAGDEMGHDALLSWTYPVPSDLQYGWITLVYELQYRRVKHPLREPHVELLGLPVGDYVVRVRCRSHNSGLWSQWSSTLMMSVPARPPTGKLLVRILVSGVTVVALLLIAFGVIPQSKRIKDYFLPPIPKPRIIGIDPLLLKKGNLDEINHHLSNFHSYRPPSYAEEVWDQVNADDVYLTTPKDCSVPANPTDREKDTLMVPCDVTPVAALHQFTMQNPTSYVQSPSPYCSSPSEAFAPPPRPEIVSLQGAEYSVMRHPGLPSSLPAPNAAARPDFYTCVQLMNESGEVHLVPCLPPTYCREFPPLPRDDGEKEEKKKKLAHYQARMDMKKRSKDGGETERREEAADPLLPVAVDNQG